MDGEEPEELASSWMLETSQLNHTKQKQTESGREGGRESNQTHVRAILPQMQRQVRSQKRKCQRANGRAEWKHPSLRLPQMGTAPVTSLSQYWPSSSLPLSNCALLLKKRRCFLRGNSLPSSKFLTVLCVMFLVASVLRCDSPMC